MERLLSEEVRDSKECGTEDLLSQSMVSRGSVSMLHHSRHAFILNRYRKNEITGELEFETMPYLDRLQHL